MPRIPLVDPETASPEVREQYEKFQSWGFPVFNVFRMFATNATALRGFGGLVEALYVTQKISPRYRELAYLRASQMNACHY